MRKCWVRVVLCVSFSSIVLAIACFAQKQAPKPDEWPIHNALIGPDSPLEIRAGASYQARAMYPVPDGPLFPLEANVAWSVEPAVQGISIDPTGKISVDAAVPHGATAIVHADVDSGRRKLSAKVYVFRPDENPLIGAWRVDTRVVCGETQEIKAAAARPLSLRGNNWKFHVSQQFWVGKEHNIAAGVRLAGTYELDLKASKIKLTPTWPKKPTSNWTYLVKEGGMTLILQPQEPQDELEPGCGYILLR
ncbi:MAG TPA: hypothetical protein VIK39_07320 [Candidatus Angelobacter sp.]